MAFWHRRTAEPAKVYLEISPEDSAAIQASFREMTDAIRRASADMDRAFKEGVKAINKATEEAKRGRTKITNHR